jgi:hypothetical protein
MATNSLKRFLTSGNADFRDSPLADWPGTTRLSRMVAAGVGK